MRIEPLTSALAPAWDAYVAAHPDGWFWHASAWLEYQRHYRAGNEDASFAVLNARGAVCSVVPLMISSGPVGAPEFSYSGDPLAVGLADGAEAAELGAARARAIARERGVKLARVASSPFGSASVFVGDRAIVRLPDNAAHRIVSLKDGGDLWRGVRRSYRSLIHRAEERYAIEEYAGDSARSVAGFVAYQALHRRLAALPRSGETYRLQGEWLLNEKALVTVAARPEGAAGAAYWIVYKGSAYYASGAYAEDDLACAVIWRSLLALRTLGVARASLGWQGRARTEKERAIEFVKRGFGGADVPVQLAELIFAEVQR